MKPVVFIFALACLFNIWNADCLSPEVFSEEYNSTMLWGTYRPGLYFGMRSRAPKGVISGLMWHDATNLRGYESMRHDANMNDGMSYAWTRHDGRTYGSQRVMDPKNDVVITTEFVKDTKGKQGGDWSVRIRGTSLSKGDKKSDAEEGTTSPRIALYYYVGTEGEEKINFYGCKGRLKKKGQANPVMLETKSQFVGDFSVLVDDVCKSEGPECKENFNFMGFYAPGENIWEVKNWLNGYMRQKYIKAVSDAASKKSSRRTSGLDTYIPLPNSLDEGSNLIVVQRLVSVPFEIEVTLASHSLHDHSSLETPKDFQSEMTHLKGKSLAVALDERKTAFEKECNVTLKGIAKKHPKYREMAIQSLSNLIGGIGYFYGRSLVAPFPDLEAQPGPAHALFTGTPSRSFFPRGFMWDEGFHNLVFSKYDAEMSKDILYHWYGAMDENGWIPREQILGGEAYSRVPSEFQKQSPLVANPPTLFLAVQSILDAVPSQYREGAGVRELLAKRSNFFEVSVNKENAAHGSEGSQQEPESKTVARRHLVFLRNLFPKLETQFAWFLKTQEGPDAHSYRWRGRTAGHLLASGLDDYPRGNNRPTDDERHLDLFCWVATMARTLGRISTALDERIKAEYYTNFYEDMIDKMDELHLHPDLGIYSDYMGKRSFNMIPGDENSHELEQAPEWSPHVGYVSLLPVALRLVDTTHPAFRRIVVMANSTEHLYTRFGLRSLSAADPLSGTAENYWRGPIWVNMNYLMMAGTHHYATAHSTKMQEPLRTEVARFLLKFKANFIESVWREWHRTGFFWEQYNPQTGQGQRSHPFNGWTSLITLIVTEQFD